MRTMIHDRLEAAQLLGTRLVNYADCNGVVVGIPNGGVSVGYFLSRILHLPLEVVPCHKIVHPSDHERFIGSVCQDEVSINNFLQDIPQDYISHQIAAHQHTIRNNLQYLYSGEPHFAFKGKTLFVVKDIVKYPEEIEATIKSLRKTKPTKIILAVPIISVSALHGLEPGVDEIVYLEKVFNEHDIVNLFPVLCMDEVKVLLENSKEKFTLPRQFSSVESAN